MKLNSVVLILDSFIIIGSLFSIVYLSGIVWRVEKKLDISYKLVLASIIFFTVSEIFGLLDLGNILVTELISLGFKAAFIIFFLLGILEVRKMLRQMDKEIPDPDEYSGAE
jgi:hypothetical protein